MNCQSCGLKAGTCDDCEPSVIFRGDGSILCNDCYRKSKMTENFNPDCKACVEKRVHSPQDWLNHPYTGHGYNREQGWSHGDLGEPRVPVEINVSAGGPASSVAL